MNESPAAIVMAGIPTLNSALYHQIRFLVGDPTALIQLPSEHGDVKRILVLRDIEMERARQNARVDSVHCPTDFTPEGGLSGDRETATAQAVAECLRQNHVSRVVADRTLPLIFAELMRQAGIEVTCDLELGILDRRSKDEQELAWIRQAQHETENAIELACRMVARAAVARDGTLEVDGQPLTSEHVRAAIDRYLLDRGYANPTSIVAAGPQGADCHDHGSGVLCTGQPVIIDVFPRNQQTRYNGDCTRTVVHGQVPSDVAQMHAAVLAAKQAAESATRAGVTGQQVHEAAAAMIQKHGFRMGLPTRDDPLSYCSMTHGTGHGLGLDVHEPPLLDKNGPPLVTGDVLTIEPGLYRRDLGGVRVEDMVVVREEGCENLNRLPTGLDWT